MFNFKFTVMRQPDLQRITFLGFKIFKIFQNFKTIFQYYLFNFCALISFQTNVCTREQKYGRENRHEKHSSTSLFLLKILKKFLYTWRMTNKFSWFYQTNLVGIRGDFCFQDHKSCISILHCAILLLLQKIFSIPSLFFPVNCVCMTSLIKGHE